MSYLKLGVNIDHIATLRQARGTIYPQPVEAAIIAERAGADMITLHMREDLRHIQPHDVEIIKNVLETGMNLELAITEDMLAFAQRIKPQYSCFVPEKREELTTEGGLDVIKNYNAVEHAVNSLKSFSEVSIFVDPDIEQINACKEAGADAVEIHTGRYADAQTEVERLKELEIIKQASQYAAKLKLIVNAGHGLNYHNVREIAEIKELSVLNIGHAIMARAFFSGLENAVKDMLSNIKDARGYVR